MLHTWRGLKQSQQLYVVRVQSSCNLPAETLGSQVCKCVGWHTEQSHDWTISSSWTAHGTFILGISPWWLTDFLDGMSLAAIHGLWLQHDGTAAHFSSPARDWLDMEYPGRWIGRGCSVLCTPWSPGLTPLDFFLWSYLKEMVLLKPSYYKKWLSCSFSCCVYFCKDRTAATCTVSHSMVRAWLNLLITQILYTKDILTKQIFFNWNIIYYELF